MTIGSGGTGPGGTGPGRIGPGPGFVDPVVGVDGVRFETKKG